MNVQAEPLNGLQLFNADGGGFKLRSAGSWINRVDSQIVSGNLIVRMDRQKRQARTQRSVKFYRSHNRPASGGYTHSLTLEQRIVQPIFRRNFQSYFTAQRRGKFFRLHAGVVVIELPASGQSY